MQRREIPLDAIDLADERFRIRRTGADETLVASIRASGVVTPPWLRSFPRRGVEVFQVVSGFRRIDALRVLGRTRVEALLLGAGDLDGAPLMEAVVLENLAGRALDPVELSRALCGLRDAGVPDDALRERYLPAAGHRGDRATLDLFLALDALPGDLREALSTGALGLPAIARVMRRFEGAAGERLLRLIRDLRLGANRQRELIALVDDLVRRDGCTLGELLAEEEIAEILRRAEENVPDARRAILDRLRRRRAPRSMAMLDTARERIRALGTDPSATLEATPWLEDRRMRLSFTFRTRAEFRAQIDRLLETDERGEIESLLRCLFGRGGGRDR